MYPLAENVPPWRHRRGIIYLYQFRCFHFKENGQNIRADLLRLYFDSKTMIRSEVFNKYKLNSVIRAYADEQNDALWATISAAFGIQTENEGCALRVIVDGTLEKLCDTHTNPDNVLERLVKFL